VEGKSTFAAQPLKGAIDSRWLSASLKRCPDTNPDFFTRTSSPAYEVVPIPKNFVSQIATQSRQYDDATLTNTGMSLASGNLP
jgi:hypothetical protein